MIVRMFLWATAMAGWGSVAMAEPATNVGMADELTELSSGTCFGIASGAIALPATSDANGLERSIETIEEWGLAYGFSNEIAGKLGDPGLALVSRSTMGSKSLAGGDIVFAVGGSQPGCHVIVLSEPDLSITELVSQRLVDDGWTSITEMTATRGTIERRAYLRRDGEGQAYLMNLMTVLAPAPGSKMRAFTTTIKVPPQVRLPEGY